jgi:hypothetical protein
LLLVVEQSELTQFVLELSEAGNFGDWQPVSDMTEQRPHIGRGRASSTISLTSSAPLSN